MKQYETLSNKQTKNVFIFTCSFHGQATCVKEKTNRHCVDDLPENGNSGLRMRVKKSYDDSERNVTS